MKIAGSNAGAVVRTILTSAKYGLTRDAIAAQFSRESQPAVLDLIDHLTRRRFLIPSSNGNIQDIETNLDIFYWHFQQNTESIAEVFKTRRLAILGVNSITRQLATSLMASQFSTFDVIDYPPLRNLRFFDDLGLLKANEWPIALKAPSDYAQWADNVSSTCLIATSDFGYTPVFSEWNRFCVERKLQFLPAVLHNMIGYIGPMVVPGETACFECLRTRQNANMTNPAMQRLSEDQAFEGQIINGFHPSMASILGDLAAFELTRFYGTCLPHPQVGTLIEVNLLNTSLKSRRVLKLPRCPVCSPLWQGSTVTPYKNAFTPCSDELP